MLNIHSALPLMCSLKMKYSPCLMRDAEGDTGDYRPSISLKSPWSLCHPACYSGHTPRHSALSHLWDFLYVACSARILFSSSLLTKTSHEWVSESRSVTSDSLLCDPVDYRVHGILQARILEWVAFSFSRESSQPRDWTQVSCTEGRFFINWATNQLKSPPPFRVLSRSLDWKHLWPLFFHWTFSVLIVLMIAYFTLEFLRSVCDFADYFESLEGRIWFYLCVGG